MILPKGSKNICIVQRTRFREIICNSIWEVSYAGECCWVLELGCNIQRGRYLPPGKSDPDLADRERERGSHRNPCMEYTLTFGKWGKCLLATILSQTYINTFCGIHTHKQSWGQKNEHQQQLPDMLYIIHFVFQICVCTIFMCCAAGQESYLTFSRHWQWSWLQVSAPARILLKTKYLQKIFGSPRIFSYLCSQLIFVTL